MATWTVVVKQLASLECTIAVEYVLCNESEFDIALNTYATQCHITRMNKKNGYLKSDVEAVSLTQCTIAVEYVLCNEREFDIDLNTYATQCHITGIYKKNGYLNSGGEAVSLTRVYHSSRVCFVQRKWI